jgi:hypothetical protein
LKWCNWGSWQCLFSLLSLSASSMIADINGWVLQFLSRLHNFQVGLTILVLHLGKFAYQICLSLEENSDRFLLTLGKPLSQGHHWNQLGYYPHTHPYFGNALDLKLYPTHNSFLPSLFNMQLSFYIF